MNLSGDSLPETEHRDAVGSDEHFSSSNARKITSWRTIFQPARNLLGRVTFLAQGFDRLGMNFMNPPGIIDRCLADS